MRRAGTSYPPASACTASGEFDHLVAEQFGYREAHGPVGGGFKGKRLPLRDEADVIITNPPFSLFREFLGWIREARKKFLVIGNMNAIT